jgi:FKBP-type peptidyl-prolyl cis-trans isomerase 2
MRTVQPGDRVQVHYVLRGQDGSVASSRGRAPLELTVGIDHPRLPGLGLALVGLAPGEGTTLTVPPERAYGWSDPARVRRWSRQRFPEDATLRAGQLVRATDAKGRRRLVRVLQASSKVVVVDANHRWAGQTLEMEIDLLAIQNPDAGPAIQAPEPERPAQPATRLPCTRQPLLGFAPQGRLLSNQGRAVAFDVDAAGLAVLREALPGWDVKVVNGATVSSLAGDWDPGSADLLILGSRGNVADTLGMCRFLALRTSCSAEARPVADETPSVRASPPNLARRADAPLLVLVLPGQDTLVGAALEAGAHSCLRLPIHAQQVARMLAHARAGNQPGRHTLNLDQAQHEDRWRDDGGQG